MDLNELKTKGEHLVQKGKELFQNSVQRGEYGQQYVTVEDFSRCPPDSKRLVVIGCTGAGKSTLLNIMAGWRCLQSKEDYSWKWEELEGRPPVFKASASVDAVTQETSFATLHWFGDEAKPFVAIDTPGHDDTSGRNLEDEASRNTLKEQAADLHNKLKALGHIDAILVCHDKVLSNRLNPATYAILQMIDEKFQGTPIWEHTIIAYTQCNEHEYGWRADLAKKKADLQKEIRNQIPGCEVDVPVIALGGCLLETDAIKADEAAKEGKPVEKKETDFDKLWEFVTEATPVDTSQLKPFDGAAWQQFENVIKMRDQAIAQAEAALAYMAVVSKLAVLLVFLFWRGMLIPSWMSVLILNMPGTTLDEIALVAALLYIIGPTKSKYCMQFFYATWVAPFVSALLENFQKAKAE